MNRLSKLFLAGSLATSAVGVFVSFTRMPLSPLWTIALPVGAILFALFLISIVFHKAFTDSDPGGQTDARRSQLRQQPSSEKGVPADTGMTPHRPAFG
jgi:hypothetical protein